MLWIRCQGRLTILTQDDGGPHSRPSILSVSCQVWITGYVAFDTFGCTTSSNLSHARSFTYLFYVLPGRRLCLAMCKNISW
jgi:hypothetical protein